MSGKRPLDGWWDHLCRCIGLRLGTPLFHPHECSYCGHKVDNLATHGLICRWSAGRHPRHAAVNDIIQRALTSAKIPSRLEPTGLCRSGEKRPDRCSIMPWSSGNVLVWDAMYPDTYAPSHISEAAREAGAVALKAEQCRHMWRTAKWEIPSDGFSGTPLQWM